MQNNQESQVDVVLKQWQVCVEMANYVSQRRDAMNNIFVTLNLAIIATVSIVWELKSILILLGGLVSCVLWLLLIRNYKYLNSAKFSVINHLEEQLPEKPFYDEWQELRNNKKYLNSTTLEYFLPVTFIVLYLVAAIAIFSIKLF